MSAESRDQLLADASVASRDLLGPPKNSDRSQISVDTMRSIDFWCGVPLCALSTLVLRWTAGLRRPTCFPRNVLLIELSEMGSAILADPSMQELRRRGANLHFVIFESNKCSLDLLRTVPEHNIFCIRSNGLQNLTADTLRFFAWARRKRIDTVIDLELFSRYTALLSGWSGARTKVGFYKFFDEGLYRGEMLTHRVPYNPHIHIARNFFSLIEAAYGPVGDLPLAKLRITDSKLELKKAVVTESGLARVSEKIRRFCGWSGHQPIVLVNANASELLPQRRWPSERFAELVGRILHHREDVLVLLTGAPREREETQALADRIDDPRCVNFAGAVTFGELIPLYHLSAVMVTNDSGPAHFAATTRMPTVVLFGPETPTLYRSLGKTDAVYAGLHCSPCVSAGNHRHTPCARNLCLQTIGVEEVFSLVRKHLDDIGPGLS